MSRYTIMWENTLPQLTRHLAARTRYVEEMNKQNSQASSPQSEAESILREAEAQGPLTMDQVREMMKEM